MSTDLKDCLGYCPLTGDVFYTKDSPFSQKCKAGHILNAVDEQGYIRFQFNGKKQRAHRVAYYLMTGSWPSKLMDHINRDRKDNRWSNLREVSPVENRANSSRDNKLKLINQ